jgi:hypothetical protein
MIGNGPGLIALLILLLSGIFTGSYLLNPIGTQAQLYFLPVLHLSKRLIFFTTNVHTNLLFIIAFITMFVMFVIGNKMAFDNR